MTDEWDDRGYTAGTEEWRASVLAWRDGIQEAIWDMPVPPGVNPVSISAIIGFDDTLMLVNWDDLEDPDADLDSLRPGDPGVLAFFHFDTMYGAEDV